MLLSKVLVSALPAVSVSTTDETPAPSGIKGKCDLHIKCLLGVVCVSTHSVLLI